MSCGLRLQCQLFKMALLKLGLELSISVKSFWKRTENLRIHPEVRLVIPNPIKLVMKSNCYAKNKLVLFPE